MNIKEVAVFSKLINDKDNIVVDGFTGDMIDKNDIEHFLIIFDSSYEPEQKQVKKRRKSKVKTTIEVEEESYVPVDDDEGKGVKLTDAEVQRIIAKQLRIVDNGALLAEPHWYVCPIIKDMDALRPMEIDQKKNYCELRISTNKIIDFTNYSWLPFTDETQQTRSNWKFNSIALMCDYIYENKCGSLQVKSIFRHKKSRYNTDEIKAFTLAANAAQRDRIKRGNSLINSLYTFLGKKSYREMKEHNVLETQDLPKGYEESISIQKLKTENTLDHIMSDYKSIISRSTSNGVNIKNDKTFEKYRTTYIPTYTMFALTKIYDNYCEIEKYAQSVLVKAVRKHPYWNRYLVRIKGVGELSAGYLISYLDPYMVPHASGFIKYCGMDVVAEQSKLPNGLEPNDGDLFRALKLINKEINIINERAANANIEEINEINYRYIQSNLIPFFNVYQYVSSMLDNDQIRLALELVPADSEEIENSDYTDIIYDTIRDNTIYELEVAILTKYDLMDMDNDVTIRRRARNMSDKVLTPYLDKENKLKIKNSLGYNTELKRRILGILSDGFLRSTGYYYGIYNDYKNAKLNNPKIMAKYTKGHINNMAKRYMCQIFVLDYYMALCQIEGIPNGGGTYAEAKLGKYHRNGLRPVPLGRVVETSTKLTKEEKI